MNTILDLLDETTGAHGPKAFLDMSFYDVYAFIDRVATLYRYSGWRDIPIAGGDQAWHWKPPARKPEEIRVHSSTIGYRGLHCLAIQAVTYTDDVISKQFGPHDVTRKLRRLASASLLYADSVVEIDPFTFPLSEGGFLEEDVEADAFRQHFYRSACLLADIRPLVEHGVVILAPDPGVERNTGRDTRLARDILGASDVGSRDEETHVRRLAAAIYGLRVAALTDATLAPDDPATWRDISRVLKAAPGRRNVHAQVGAGLASVDLPFLAGIRAETILRIRQDEDAFAAWRAQLRAATRILRYDVSEDAFRKEAQEVLRDLLEPQAAEVRRAASRSAAVRKVLRSEPLTLGLGGLAAGGSALAAGLPLTGALIGAAGGALGRVAVAAARREKPTGAARVIYELIH
jgi:hypothetical protein